MPQRPGRTRKRPQPAEPSSHSVSFVRQNKVIFDKRICWASQRVVLRMEVGSRSQQADPRPWQSQPLKGNHSIVMSQCWYLSSQRGGLRLGSQKSQRREQEIKEWERRKGFGQREHGYSSCKARLPD